MLDLCNLIWFINFTSLILMCLLRKWALFAFHIEDIKFMVGRVKGVGLNPKLFIVKLVYSFYNISFILQVKTMKST